MNGYIDSYRFMESEKIVRFLREELTESEKLEVLDWIDKSDENRSMFSELKNTMILADFFGKDQGSLSQNTTMNGSPGLGQFKKFKLLKYAASALIVLALGSLLLLQRQKIYQLTHNYVEYVVPNGQTSNIVLSDGSHVYLNSGSILRQYGNYFLLKRELHLEGEAFFDVVSNRKKPFIVRTSSFNVVATGTSFNVQAYSNSDFNDVTLVSGELSVNFDNKGEPLLLSSGEHATMSRNTSKFSLSKIENHQFVSWKEGIITFRNTRLEDLAKMLERTYNVRIVFADERTKEMRYSGTMLRYKPIDQILDILEMTSEARFEIETRTNEPNLITVK